MKPGIASLGLLALMVGVLAGCLDTGTTGGGGTTPPPGTTTATSKTVIVDLSSLTTQQWADSQFTGNVTAVTIGSDGKPVVDFKIALANGNAVTGFANNTSKSSTATVRGYTNLAFAIGKLVPGSNSSPSKWVSYMVTSVPSTTAPTVVPAKPTSDNQGTLVDNGDGSYRYTFYRAITGPNGSKAIVDGFTDSGNNLKADLGDLTYDPALTHRVAVQISGNARGTGTNTDNAVQTTVGVPLTTPVDLIYDFIPATGRAVTAADTQREIVQVSSCFSCHSKFGFHGGNEITGVGGSRQDTRYCMLCHTDQRKYGAAETTTTATGYSGRTNKINNKSVFEFPTFIHKIHMGDELIKTGYNAGGVLFNDIAFPQDVRNCTKCHDGSATATNKTAQGDNWKNVPSRFACGACHDGIDWATGRGETLNGVYSSIGHVGGAKADDASCVLCHTPDSIALNHVPVTPPDPNNGFLVAGGNNNTNASYIAAYPNNLPAGARRITYDLSSVTIVSGKPTFKFRFMDSTDAATPTPVVFNAAPAAASATTELMPNFVGGPSAYFVAAIPQDGVAVPADYNISVSGYIRNCWNKTATSGTSACTMTGPGSDGYYTLTLTGVAIPTNAVMKTGGIGYTYALSTTQPLTQTDVPNYPYNTEGKKQGGVSVPAPNVTKVVSGDTARRQIVETARCVTCHNALGVFAKSQFHAGQRNDANSCAFCHNPNRTSSGWSADSAAFVHAIHGSAKRGAATPFTWHASSTTDSFAQVAYPGILRNCQQCHLPDVVNFGFTASGSAATTNTSNSYAAQNGNLLYSTVGVGRYSGTVGQTNVTYAYNSTTGTCVAGTSAPQTDVGTFSLSPYVVRDGVTNYGSGFVANVGLTTVNGCKPDGTVYTLAPGSTLPADGTTLVNSPIANACFGCHTTTLAKSHMRINGGSLYAPRATALATTETCLVCHAAGRVADVQAMHKP